MTEDHLPMGLVRCYQRHGGFMQTYPLTEKEQRYDDTCREIDKMENAIRGLPMSLFMAGEFLWFSWFTNKLFMGLKQEQLDEQLRVVTDLLKTLTERGLAR